MLVVLKLMLNLLINLMLLMLLSATTAAAMLAMNAEKNTIDSSLAHLPLEGANLLGEAEPRKATCKELPFTKALMDPGPINKLTAVLANRE